MIFIIIIFGFEWVEIVVVNLIMYCVLVLSVFLFNIRVWLEIFGIFKMWFFNVCLIKGNKNMWYWNLG